MVLGTPTTGIPIFESLFATPRVSSPPIATSASIPNLLMLSSNRCTFSSSLKGFVRDVPRIVPPFGRIPVTE
ncbi:MAG: hypothetical protein BWX50_00246 [Euryarchaeota archaeon ADurb.Bin009]|nr:MAG: hypothetical protein BWX50_00246 [Euryarchaeota archaeon ADurb.Bin009]